MKKEKSCGAIVFYDDNVLLVEQLSGNIGFPKGHVMLDENEEETAIREVKEETNLDIEITNHKRYSISYLVDKNIEKEVVYFVAKPKGEIDLKKQDSEINRVFWVSKDEVKDKLTFDNLRNVWSSVYYDL